MEYRFVQLDVFTDEPFTGNALAVFPESEGLTDEQMQRIAREMNLSETVFVLPSEHEGVLRRLRIFTPTSELKFAGHPIAGTWNCLAREGVVPLPEGGSGTVQIKHEVGIGVLPVEIEFKNGEPTRVVMTQGNFEIKAEIEDWQDQADIARGLGLSREDLDETLPIQACSTGNTMLIVPIRSLADLGRCRPNLSLLEEVYARHTFADSGRDRLLRVYTRNDRSGRRARPRAIFRGPEYW
jgi:trans-2,3-dihydro-3-hydroxyanthranilate isomerase